MGPHQLRNNGASSPFDLSDMDAQLSGSLTGAKPKKSAEAFLGPNSGLVNLENLVKSSDNVPTKPGISPLANPFSLGSGQQQANPFQQQTAPRPSINELRNQQNFGGLQQQQVPLQQQSQQQQSMGAWGGQSGSGSVGASSPTFNP